MKHWTDSLVEGKTKAGDDIMMAVIKEIARKTDQNDHSGAVLSLAKLIRDKRMIKAAQSVVALHEFFGHMPSELIKVRTEIMNMGLKRAEKLYPDYADKIHGAF